MNLRVIRFCVTIRREGGDQIRLPCGKEFVMPFGLQPAHLLVILVVALLIFGPSKLPEIGKAMGKTIREFQTGIKEATQGFTEEVKTDAAKTEAPPACKKCGKPLTTGAKFCAECGEAQ
jgi:sec-independent protein translocase protein TatA